MGSFYLADGGATGPQKGVFACFLSQGWEDRVRRWASVDVGPLGSRNVSESYV